MFGNKSVRDIISGLNKILFNAVERGAAPGILFSGGLDSGIIAAIVCRLYTSAEVYAVTVSLANEGEDIVYSKEMAQVLQLKHIIRSISVDEAIASIPVVIRALGTFDPAIPNDITAYYGLKTLIEMGITSFMTGDGADELFGGYDFMKDIENLSGYLRRISSYMSFNSNRLAAFLAMNASQPFLDKEIIEYALNIPDELRIRKEREVVHGKWVLRKAFENLFPARFIWQGKRPLECGSGMTRLREIISSMVDNDEFKNNPYPVSFFNKEHYYYYRIYRKVIGEIPGPKEGEKACPGCSAGIAVNAFHCRICGHVIEWRQE